MFDEDFTRAIWHPLLLLESNVADPDPYVFGPPGSGFGSNSQRYGSGSDPDTSIIKQK